MLKAFILSTVYLADNRPEAAQMYFLKLGCQEQ